MYKTYLKDTLRHVTRNKSYTFITVLSLALAIACSIVLIGYIRSELSYDLHHVDNEKIYRVLVESTTGGGTERLAIAAKALAPLFKKAYPDMVEFVRMSAPAKTVFTRGNGQYRSQVLNVDTNFFDIFTHEVIYGELSNALDEPTSIAISEGFSKEIFGDRNPVGESLSFEPYEYEVTLVFADIPENSHVQYSAVTSIDQNELFGKPEPENILYVVFDLGLYTYFKTKEDYTELELQNALDAFYKEQVEPVAQQYDIALKYYIQPLNEVHFESGWDFDQPVGNIFYVYGFIAVAFFVVLIACINYTNLATAVATKRAKEISIRKIIGSGKQRLVIQFMNEAFIYSFMALFVGLILVYCADLHNGVNQLIGKSMLVSYSDYSTLFYILAGTLFLSIFAGSYPAFYLSSTEPISALTGTKSGKKKGFALRQSLVFSQFFISVCVLSATFVMGLQMDYISHKPKGFNSDNKLVITLQSADTIEKLDVIKNQLLINANVLGVAESSYIPGETANPTFALIEQVTGEFEQKTVSRIEVSHEFVDVMGIEIVQGRRLTKRLVSDSKDSVLVNESMVKLMGWSNPIGKKLDWGEEQARVVGVMGDFHFSSLHQSIEPLFLTLQRPGYFIDLPPHTRNLISRDIIVSISNENMSDTIGYIETVVSRLDPEHPFEYHFFDSLQNDLYTEENNLISLTLLLAVICLFVSCMGLYGLATFTMEQRKKEIGIRKVLGATSIQIINMLVRSTLLLALSAGVIGSLVTYFVIDSWLQMFAYRITIQPWVFFLSTSIVVFVSLATVSFQSLMTVRANLVEILRFE